MVDAYVDAPHVREWIADHGARVVDADVARQFDAALSLLPWSGISQPDWHLLNAFEVDIDSPTLHQDMEPAAISRFAHALLIYTPDERALVAERRALFDDVDLLCSGYAGNPAYMCGAVLGSDGIEIVPEALAVWWANTITLRR